MKAMCAERVKGRFKMNRRLTIMSKFVRTDAPAPSERVREPPLERPHRARRTHVGGIARPARSIGQSYNVLLGAFRAIDDRDQDAARANQSAECLGWRPGEGVGEEPVVTLL